MDIVFSINSLGLEGIGSTLTSLIRNCSNPSELKLWFLCSGFKENDKLNINHLLKLENFAGSAEYIDFNAQQLFGHMNSLHGDWTTYGRLLIADHVKSDSALYLDSDLVVLLDVLILKKFVFNESILAAVYGSTVAWALEHSFFINELNWDPEKSYFNAGVLLFNLKLWRKKNIEASWKKIANKHPAGLVSHDQTLLNAVCNGEFALLPSCFNNAWYPGHEKPGDADKSIIHFVGSPKPWDVFGSVIHKGYDTWDAYNTDYWKRQYGKITPAKLRRAWKIRKSLFRNLVN